MLTKSQVADAFNQFHVAIQEINEVLKPMEAERNGMDYVVDRPKLAEIKRRIRKLKRSITDFEREMQLC